MFSLKDKTAIVTGGGSGIGRAIAVVFARQGGSVHIIDMDENASKVVEEINAAGGKSTFHPCNVSIQSEIKSIVESIAVADGGIHILVNNAGIAHIGNAETTAEEDIVRLFNVNINGVYNCLHEVIPVMKKTGGSILNMASIASSVGITD